MFPLQGWICVSSVDGLMEMILDEVLVCGILFLQSLQRHIMIRGSILVADDEEGYY